MSTLEHPEGEPTPESAPPPSSTEAEPDRDTERSTLEHEQEDELDDPLDRPEIAVDPTKVRHAPRFGRFATVGGIAGMALGFLLTPFASYENLNVAWHFDPWGLGLVMAAILTPIGVLVGCVIALVSDRRSRRRVRR
jgi:hypothetical protein